MTSQLNYLIVQRRHIEPAHRAEQARLAKETHPAGSPSSPRWDLAQLLAPRRLLAQRRLRAAGLAAAATQARSAPPQQCLRCDT